MAHAHRDGAGRYHCCDSDESWIMEKNPNYRNDVSSLLGKESVWVLQPPGGIRPGVLSMVLQFVGP
eukprot:6209336-Pleurochrysis_carterae.AAC.3